MKRRDLFDYRACLALLILFSFPGCNRSTGTPPVAPPIGASASQVALNFVDVTAKAGIGWQRANGAFGKKWFPETAGGGGAFIDYDNDGYPDIVLINGDWWPGHTFAGSRPKLALYHNNRDGSFTDVTQQMGLDISLQGMGVAVGDYDNDGYDDLYITGVGGNRLLHNESGKGFKDVTKQAGVGGSGWSTSAAWVDIDNDGKLDLFVCHYIKWTPATDIYCGGQVKAYCTPISYPGESSRLYHNDGNGHFTDITRKAGLLNDSGKALGICTVDYDHDGFVDLFVANDGEPNLAYHNRGNGTFEDVSVTSGLALGEDGKPRNGMGIDASDYRNDGKLGVLVGNFSFQGVGLHREQAGGLFLDVSREAGLAQPSYPYVTFGVMFCDVDNDGWKDALITNGHVDDIIEKSSPGQRYLQPTQIFLNRHDGSFADLTGKAGPGLTQPLAGRGIAWGDFDNDGKPDLLLIPNIGPPRLLHNETQTANHWVTLSFTGTRSNRDGYGAFVRLTSGGLTQTDTVRSGSSYCSQSDRRLHFGLGSTAGTVTVEVRWPSGLKETWHNLPADKTSHLTEGKAP
jgi:hypothetical protein